MKYLRGDVPARDLRARYALRRAMIAIVLFAGLIDALMRSEPAYPSPYDIVAR